MTLTHQLGITYPILCGAMYPCSNPELVAAVSRCGGLGIVQPLSLVYVHGYEFRAGLHYIRSLTANPIGMNVIVEKNSRLYESRMRGWVDIALDEGVRFFVTALGKPDWVVEKAHAKGALVFHDVTHRQWALRALECGVDGFICVNNRAGGHAGTLSMRELYESLCTLGKPLIAAGGISTRTDVMEALALGYAAVQLGTRFVASIECTAPPEYKQAIVEAGEGDIVTTERVTGVPLSVIRTPYVAKVGTTVGPLSRFLFRYRRTRHLLRFLYNVRSVMAFKRSMHSGMSTKDYYQAGKSVSGIDRILSVEDIFSQLTSEPPSSLAG